MLVTVTARSHRLEDRVVDRFGHKLPVGVPTELDLSADQVTWLQADPWVDVAPVVSRATPEAANVPVKRARRSR